MNCCHLGSSPSAPEQCSRSEIWQNCTATCPALCFVNLDTETNSKNNLLVTNCLSSNNECRPGCACSSGHTRQLGHGDSFICVPDSACAAANVFFPSVPLKKLSNKTDTFFISNEGINSGFQCYVFHVSVFAI